MITVLGLLVLHYPWKLYPVLARSPVRQLTQLMVYSVLPMLNCTLCPLCALCPLDPSPGSCAPWDYEPLGPTPTIESYDPDPGHIRDPMTWNAAHDPGTYTLAQRPWDHPWRRDPGTTPGAERCGENVAGNFGCRRISVEYCGKNK